MSNAIKDDVIYYNLTIGTSNNQTIGKLYNDTAYTADATVNNNEPIVLNPSQYYCSIIRLMFPAYSLPLVDFSVQVPYSQLATDPPPYLYNRGIYSFTLTHGATSTTQNFYQYVPEVKFFDLPPISAKIQDRSTGYYNIYSYDHIVNIMNTTLETAFLELQGLDPSLGAAQVPFFVYNHETSKIDLYADKAYFDKSLATPIKIYFNSPSYIYMKGFYYIAESVNQLQGRDNYFVIDSNHTLNDKIINTTTYVVTSQEFVSLQYMSPLKSIIVKTNMSVRPEAYNISSPESIQNVGYDNIICDFLPDISAPYAGIGSYEFIYNAPSLYRVFQFYQTTPLYVVNSAIFWADKQGNVQKLYLPKGQVVEIKFMFIKKNVFDFGTINKLFLNSK